MALLLYNIIYLEVNFVLKLQEIIHQLVNKDSIVIQGDEYKVDNVVYITDAEILKTRFLLKNTKSEDKIAVDIDISAKIYKC